MEHGLLESAGGWVWPAAGLIWSADAGPGLVLHHDWRHRGHWGELRAGHATPGPGLQSHRLCRILVSGQWTVLSALTGPRGILIIRPQPAVGRECLRSQLRNKHVFCKEGQITWLTLLSPQTLHHRPHVTRGYQELPAIRPHHHRCCINSAGFNAKPPLLSLFA